MSSPVDSGAGLRVRVSGPEPEVRAAAARIAAVLDDCTPVRVTTARSERWVYGRFEACAKPRPGAVLPTAWTGAQVRVRLVADARETVLIGLALTAAVLAPDPDRPAPQPVLGEKDEWLIYYRTTGQADASRPTWSEPRVHRSRRRS